MRRGRKIISVDPNSSQGICPFAPANRMADREEICFLILLEYKNIRE